MLKERVESENSFLIAVVPDFVLKGHDDAVEYSNALTFFILDKIDYSEKDNDAYIDVFARTQIKVHRFIEQLLKDKSNYSASYCNFLRQLNIQSVRVVPYWEHNDCNGWQIDFNVLTH
jgi:hypothetical protein